MTVGDKSWSFRSKKGRSPGNVSGTGLGSIRNIRRGRFGGRGEGVLLEETGTGSLDGYLDGGRGTELKGRGTHG